MNSNINQRNERHLILTLFSKDAVCELKQVSHIWEGRGCVRGREKKERRHERKGMSQVSKEKQAVLLNLTKDTLCVRNSTKQLTPSELSSRSSNYIHQT